MPYDYGQLADLARPQVPGGAGRVSLSGLAGQAYGEDYNRQSGYLSNAADEASVQAGTNRMKANEFAAGNPGRMAETQVNNSLSQGKLGTLPDLLSTQSDTARTAATNASSSKIKAEEDKLLPYANDWSQAKTPADKEDVISKMEKDGVTHIGARALREIPPDRMDGLMGMLRNKQINTPAQAQKIQAIQEQGNSWNNREAVKGEYRLADTQLKLQAQSELATLKAQWAQKPLTESQWKAKMLTKMENGDMSKIEQATWAHYQAYMMERDRAKAGNQPPQLNPNALPPGLVNPPGQPRPIPIPSQGQQPQQPQPQTAAAPALAAPTGWQLDLQRGTASMGGKSQKIVEESATQYKLEDGTLVPK